MKKVFAVSTLIAIVVLAGCQNNSKPIYAKTYFESNSAEIEALYQYFVQESKLDGLWLSFFGNSISLRVVGNPNLPGKNSPALKTNVFKAKDLDLNDKSLDNILMKINMPRDSFDSLVQQMKALEVKSVSYIRSRGSHDLRYLVNIQVPTTKGFCNLFLVRSPSGDDDDTVERNIRAEDPEDGPIVVAKSWFAYRACSL